MAAGTPFTLLMADGKEYPVPHPDFIFVMPVSETVLVCKENGAGTFLPLGTMTGLQYAVD